MIEAFPSHPLPDNEAERLALLRDFKILDTPPDPGFDEICQILKEQLDVPIMLISLADQNRHWFKARIGIDLSEVARETSFCTYTILNDDPLVLPDARRDPRFAANPFVTGEPFVRFYAGVPLLARPGLAIGSLCAIDVRPRSVEKQDVVLMQRMARIVIEQLKHHRAVVDLDRELAARRRHAGRVARQRALLNRQRKFAEQSARLAGIGGWSYDVSERHLSWSKKTNILFGLTTDKTLTFDDLIDLVVEADRPAVQQVLGCAMREGENFDIECHIGLPSGELRRVRFTCEAVVVRGEVVRLAGTVQDVTSHYERRKQVERQARIDALTSLPNRVSLMDTLEEALRVSAERDSPAAVLLADLDHFKSVNDTLGHDVGDAILRMFADRVRGRVRGSDIVARLGGDEFAVVLHDVKNAEGAQRVAQEIVEAGSSPFVHGDQVLNVGISIGIRVFTGSKATSEQILKDADIALYNAKAKGRNGFAVFHKNMRKKIEDRQSSLLEVKSGLDNGEFAIHFQPQIALVNNRLIGLEALLRWKHPTEGTLSPSGFRDALSDFKLSRDLSNFALEQAVEQMAKWSAAGLSFGSLAVNVSHSQITQVGFAERVIALLRRHRLATSLLTIEVVEETVLIDNLHAAVDELQKLHDAGVTVSLDDFGTGYASLIHLRKYPIRQIKIDGSFINNVDRDIMGLSIVKSIIDLADSLKMRVIAEGVERASIANLLRQCGCHGGQGFLWSQALTPGEATAYLHDAGQPAPDQRPGLRVLESRQ